MSRKKWLMLLSMAADALIVFFTAYYIVYLLDGSLKNYRNIVQWFTMDSNIFCALTSLLMLIDGACALAKGREEYHKGFLLLKFTGTTAVMVTFTTVMLFLGIIYGYESMFAGDGFYMHLVGPVLALVSYTALNRGIRMKRMQAGLALIPVVLYGAVYIRNVLITRQWSDFYGFNRNGRWGLSIVLMGLMTLALGIGVRYLHNRCDRREE